MFNAALKIQCRQRMYTAKKLLFELNLNACARRIQFALQACICKWKRKAAFRIVTRARVFLKWRWEQARKIRRLICWYYRRKLRSAKVLQRFIRRSFVRWRLFETMRRMKLSFIASQAVTEVKRRLDVKLDAYRCLEREKREVQEAVIDTVENMILRVEKIDEEGRERMSRANSGFLFDFVDRYEIDRRRVLASLPSESYNGQKEYDFEDAPPTTCDSGADYASIAFRCEPPKISLVKNANKAVAVEITRAGVDNLSRIGAGVIEREKQKSSRDLKRPTNSCPPVHPVSSRSENSKLQLATKGIPEFINIPARAVKSSLSREDKRKKESAKEKRRERGKENERRHTIQEEKFIPQPPSAQVKKISKKKKQSSRPSAVLSSAFDINGPPEFSNFTSLPPSVPLTRPPNVSRPDKDRIRKKEYSRPRSCSSMGVSQRTDYLKANEKDYLEALRSLNLDLEAAAAHYAHKEDKEREALVSLHLPDIYNVKVCSRPIDVRKQSKDGSSTKASIHTLPDFAVNRVDYALQDHAHRPRPPQSLGLPGRPQSAGATSKKSHVSRIGILRHKDDERNGNMGAASDKKVVISFNKYNSCKLFSGAEQNNERMYVDDGIFATDLRGSYDYSDFKMPIDDGVDGFNGDDFLYV